MNIDTIFLNLNAIITIACGIAILILLYRKILEPHPFYYFHIAGFIVYGLEIFLRGIYPNIPVLIYFYIMSLSLLLFCLGIWTLVRKKLILSFIIILYASSYLIAFISYSIKLSAEAETTLSILVAFLSYGTLAILLAYHRAIFGRSADLFIMGWASLMIINLVLFGSGWLADLLAILSKLIIFLGIITHDFIIVVRKVNEVFQPRPIPPTLGEGEEGELILGVCGLRQLPIQRVSQWLLKLTEDNVAHGIETNIIVLQDVLPRRDLRSALWIDPEMVHIFLFSQSPAGSDEFAQIKLGLTELGATITEIARSYAKKRKRAMIILINLSILIHLFGSLKIYSFLLDKMGIIRSSGVTLIAVFHPETHDDKVVALFKTIADRIIEI